MKFTTIDQIKTCYYTGGQGPKHVLFLHGWASSGKMWLRSMWAMRGEYRMWALDLPGFGDTQAFDDERYSIERYADHVAAFCKRLKIRPYGVVGHSMGGRIALDLARRYPRLADRVIAVSPSLTGRLSYNLNIFLMGEIGEWVLGFARKVWPVAIASTMSMYWTPRYLGTEAVERTTNDLRRADWEAARASLDALLAHDYSPYLPEISQPTLVIHGVRDRTVPLADSKIAARALPRARLMTLDGVHHQPMDEVPQLFYQAVRSFLANGYAETV